MTALQILDVWIVLIASTLFHLKGGVYLQSETGLFKSNLTPIYETHISYYLTRGEFTIPEILPLKPRTNFVNIWAIIVYTIFFL